MTLCRECRALSLHCWRQTVLTLHAMVPSVVRVRRSDGCTRGSHIPVCIPCLLFAFLWQAKDIIAPSSTLERRPPGAQSSTPDARCSIIGERNWRRPLGDKSKQQPPLSAPADAVLGMRACHIDLPDHRLGEEGK